MSRHKSQALFAFQKCLYKKSTGGGEKEEKSYYCTSKRLACFIG